ncbi:benomyl/methotrexate resistance protein [Drechmeria coniospora]|uniref:Benomyl/methotrexate resistance protein n=1 Tax=Drechmeria coniospora TaxID=98403 RepID=A0A151GPK4_DRECN|nr:benomyl/methotrexate resistance protein [Drechmeria coniospora]KYK59039.1 benomyl/methotrexate resistance protein [Drechmeria coniospora]
MGTITRILSRPVNKPFRTKHLRQHDKDVPPYLNANGNVDFGPGDVENPHNWSTARRWGVTVAAVMLVMNATFASSSPSGCLPSIAGEFGISVEAAGLTISLFLLGYCAGPLVFAPLSELYGRRWIFYITFTLYIAFNFLCAFAPTFASLLVGRFITGTLVSAPLSNAPGVLADLWDPLERGNAMAGFSAMVWIGPALGPVISGFLQLTRNWRWSFYVLIWLGAATWLLMLTIPETHGPTILRHKAERIREAALPGYEDVKAPAEEQDRSLRTVYKVALTRPWIILFDPISFLCAIYLAVVYTLLYMLFSIYPIVFQEKRGWNAGVGQLPLIGTVVGAVIGSLVVLYDTRRHVKKVENGTLSVADLEPEHRLPLGMVGGVGFAITMFWLAWSAEFNSVHWIVPTLAGVFLSASLLLIFVAYLGYLVDTYLMYAASAIAANTIFRSACGAAAPLFTHQMFDAMGVGGGGSLIAAVATVLAIIPFMFYKYGKRIRARSRFAPTKAKMELKVADEEAPRATDVDSGSQSHGESEVSSTAPTKPSTPPGGEGELERIDVAPVPSAGEKETAG